MNSVSPSKGEHQPLNRLCGIETEYAMHFEGASRPWYALWAPVGETHRDRYLRIIETLQEQIPAVPAKSGKAGVFLANGAALWFERGTQGKAPFCEGGLFEAATPECNSPKQLVAASHAIDRLLFRATQTAEAGAAPTRLLKNCLDPKGISYGAQENYEVDLYEPEDLDRWNLKVNLLTAFAKFGLIIHILVFVPLLAIWALLSFVSRALAFIAGQYNNEKLMWFLTGGKDDEVPPFAAPMFWFVLRVVLIPNTICVALMYRSSAFWKTYKALRAFLISRVIFAGAGGLDREGRFMIGQKASTRTTDWFTWLIDIQRPIFCPNTLFKELVKSLDDEGRTGLYKRRQRITISIGDSNMCEQAEYLRIATTSLVLDAIEAGAISDPPLVNWAISKLKRFNNDPSLNAKVKTSRGRMSAIEIQQYYLNACRRYVESLPNPPEEAHEILRLWSDTLRRLVADPESLFGCVDWITKRRLMREAAKRNGENDSSPATGTRYEFRKCKSLDAMRKIDVRYHELSHDGYYYRLAENECTESMFDDREISRAARMPALSERASQRARYIREFTDEIEWVEWDRVKLTDQSRIIELG